MLGDYKLTIKIFGIGGGGCNAISRIAEHIEEFGDIQLIAANTDSMSLANIGNYNFVKTIQLGEKKTKGMGAGALPEVGRLATEESYEEIAESIKDADLLFITAGMGGGTGTGGAPVVAKIAKEHKVLTIGIVTLPFSSEGTKKMRYAMQGVKEMQENVDAMILVSNEQAFLVCDPGTSMRMVFEKADEVLHNSIKAITDIIVNHTLINLDFADICTIIRNKKTAHIGLGVAKGEDRTFKALRMASTNKLLKTNIKHAKYILINVIVDVDVTCEEINKAMALIPSVVAEDAVIVNGLGFDPELNEEVKVTIIATGLYGEELDENKNTEQVDSVASDYEEDGVFDDVELPNETEEPQDTNEQSRQISYEDFLKKLKG